MKISPGDEVTLHWSKGNLGFGPGVKLEEVSLDAIAEKHTAFRHERPDPEGLFSGDGAEDEVALGLSTRKGLAHGEIEALGIPREIHKLRIDLTLITGRRSDGCGTVDEALEPSR